MTLDTRAQMASACKDQIRYAFALAEANGLNPRDVVAVLLDTERSIWARHPTFAGMRRVPVTIGDRTWQVTCAVLDRASVLDWWGSVYPTSCKSIVAMPDQHHTFVMGFDEPDNATLFSGDVHGISWLAGLLAPSSS